MRAWASLVAACLCLPRVAAGELSAGLYAVSCGQLARGSSVKEALRGCEQAVRKADLGRQCGCKKHADIVRIVESAKPAFYITHEWHTGPTAAAALTACHK